MSLIGKFLTRGCMSMIAGMVGFIVLLWGIGTCMGFDANNDVNTNDNAAASDTISAPVYRGDVEPSGRDLDAVDVPFDESSTVVLGE